MTTVVVIVVLIGIGLVLVAVFRSEGDGSTPPTVAARPSGKPCPACGDDLPREQSRRVAHLTRHTRPIQQDGQRGYLWECRDSCGHSDRFWSTPSDAALAMTAHLMQRHSILPS